MKKLIAALLLIALSSTTWADGVNKKKARRRSPAKVVVVKADQPRVKTPSLLSTPAPYAGVLLEKPLQPLLNIPAPVKQIPVVTVESETRVFEFDHKRSKLPFVVFGLITAGVVTGIILSGDDKESSPTPTPVSSPPSSVPEPSTVSLWLLSLLVIAGLLVRKVGVGLRRR